MNFQKTRLTNGLRVLTVPMASFESATAAVWVKTGSRKEESKVNGISHFLEHMAFKGSSKRPTAKLIAETIDSIGGEFNAGTAKEWTNFYVKARGEHMEIVFDVLSDMLINPILDASEIEKEKGVITEEIAMYEDTPLYRIGDIFEQLVFTGNPLGRDIIGTPQTVRSVKRNDFVKYRDIHFFGKNMLLTVSGGVNQKKMLELANKYFGGLREKSNKSQAKLDKFTIDQKKPRTLLHAKKKDQTHLILGFYSSRYAHEDRYSEALLATVLGGGMSSRMFTEVREKRGLAYAVRTSSDNYIDTGYLSTYAGVDTKRAVEAVSVMLDQYYQIAESESSITEEELTKAKEYLKGHLALSLEDSRNVNGFFSLEELMTGKPRTPEEVMLKLDKVTRQDVHSFASRIFTPKRLNLAIIGPFKDATKFEKALR